MSRLRKFLSLNPKERQLLINAFVLLVLVRLGLWLLPFPALRQMLININQINNLIAGQQYSAPTIDRIVEAVNRSSHYMPGRVKCLTRALTTQILMSRCGYFPELCIGVAKVEGGKLEAHAWVESQGQVVVGNLKDLSRFTPMISVEGGKL